MADCRKCHTALPVDGRFCPHCGASKAVRGPRSAAATLVLVLVGGGIWACAWYTQQSLSGVKPNAPFSAAQKTIESPELHALRKTASQSPHDIDGWRNLVSALIEKLSKDPTPSNDEVFELIDALRAILQIDPNDPNALQAMAELSFQQRVFDKALEYYQRLMSVRPEDLDIRMRYASVLTLIGQGEKAEVELRTVLAKRPDEFAANAYLTLALAQKGQIAAAKKSAEKALKLAPSEEARREFAPFIERLNKTPEGTRIGPEADKAAPPQPSPSAAAIDSVIDTFFKSNPVAGPKYVETEIRPGGVIAPHFRDFPISAMPPFAKEKFFGGIKAFVSSHPELGINEVVFVEATTGKELDRLKVQ